MSKESEEILLKMQDQLMKSHWPKCDVFAKEIATYNNETARNILVQALKANRHHIRTAAVRNLLEFKDHSLVDIVKPLLNDPAYETRMEAKKFIKEITGEDVLTGRDE